MLTWNNTHATEPLDSVKSRKSYVSDNVAPVFLQVYIANRDCISTKHVAIHQAMLETLAMFSFFIGSTDPFASLIAAKINRSSRDIKGAAMLSRAQSTRTDCAAGRRTQFRERVSVRSFSLATRMNSLYCKALGRPL